MVQLISSDAWPQTKVGKPLHCVETGDQGTETQCDQSQGVDIKTRHVQGLYKNS